LKARIETDLDSRTVEILEIEVPRVRFRNATEEPSQEFAASLTREITSWDMSLSLDRLAAMLDLTETRRRIAEGLDDTPPKILFVSYPAILVTIDGEPQLREVEGSTTLKHVVNTPFLMVLSPRGGFYLYAGDETWYAANQVMGPWTSATNVPSDVAALAPIAGEREAAREAQALAEQEDTLPEEEPSQLPAILVATESTELIVTTGNPEWGPVGEGDLLRHEHRERCAHRDRLSGILRAALRPVVQRASPSTDRGAWESQEQRARGDSEGPRAYREEHGVRTSMTFVSKRM